MDSVMEEIRTIISDKGGVARDLVKPSSTLAGLGLDDLDIDEVIMALETAFELTLSEDEEITLAKKTVQGMADYVAARIRR